MIWDENCARTVQRLIDETSETWGIYERPIAKRLGALPVGQDMVNCYYLRPIGEVWMVREGFPEDDLRRCDDRELVSVHVDHIHRIWALVWGSTRRYPELRALLPPRPADAVDCLCAAHPILVERCFFCDRCGGLRWIEATFD